jgi:hypothetical protein
VVSASYGVCTNRSRRDLTPSRNPHTAEGWLVASPVISRLFGIFIVRGVTKFLSGVSRSVRRKLVIPSEVTGHGGPLGCETSRLPHCLDNRLTVNCEMLATCSSTYSPVRTS